MLSVRALRSVGLTRASLRRAMALPSRPSQVGSKERGEKEDAKKKEQRR